MAVAALDVADAEAERREQRERGRRPPQRAAREAAARFRGRKYPTGGDSRNARGDQAWPHRVERDQQERDRDEDSESLRPLDRPAALDRGSFEPAQGSDDRVHGSRAVQCDVVAARELRDLPQQSFVQLRHDDFAGRRIALVSRDAAGSRVDFWNGRARRGADADRDHGHVRARRALGRVPHRSDILERLAVGHQDHRAVAADLIGAAGEVGGLRDRGGDR